ncbi:MAG: PEP-CTERM sorting domain-containing protein [Pirellulales bacterium]
MNRFRSLFVRVFGVAVAIAAVTCCAANARADLLTQNELPVVFPTAEASTGSQGFADIGTPVADTSNINTASTLTIGNLISTGASVGYFTGLSTQTFGPVAFNPAVASSIGFGNGTFGSFLSTSITEQTNAPGERSFYVLGHYTAGTFNPALVPNPAPASMTISFTQSPAGVGGAISDSATLSIPPAVPEPTTSALAGIGIAGALVLDQSRRHRRRRSSGN